MSLFAGPLFAGALFAGAMFGGAVEAPEVPPVVAAASAGGGAGYQERDDTRRLQAQRIKAQNDMIIQLVTAIVTSEMLE